MVKKTFIALGVIWLALVVLMPKQEMYYKLEQILAEEGIKINEKHIQEGWFSLDLDGLEVYAKGIKLADIESLSLFTVLFYTNIEIDNIVLDELLKDKIPTKIDTVNLSHAVWNPMHVGVNGEGPFGSFKGDVQLSERIVRLDFNDTKGIENLQPQLKQDEKGWYYETSF